MRIAVLNTGTATVKSALVEVRPRDVHVESRHTLSFEGESERGHVIRSALERLEPDTNGVDAIGHRVVHGGSRYMAPTLIDRELEGVIEKVAPLAPLLNTSALEGIRIAREMYPRRPMVDVFDTSFHAGRPLESLTYALPRELTDSYGIYRYGFHGIAHESLARALAELERQPLKSVTALTLQLGGGCSACAIEDGRSIETTTGFTPLEGFMCTTRSGSLDPAVVLHLVRQGLPPRRIERLLTEKAGLLGCGGTADVRELLRREQGGDERARLALRVFVRRIATTAGGYLTLLGGRGSIVIGGGIGSRSPEMRARIAQSLAAWDVRLDPQLNAGSECGRISEPGSRPVYFFRTEEERVIAQSAARALAPQPAAG
jgi:acetate kinase